MRGILVKGNGKVLDIPESSTDFTITVPGYGTHTYIASSPWGECSHAAYKGFVLFTTFFSRSTNNCSQVLTIHMLCILLRHHNKLSPGVVVIHTVYESPVTSHIHPLVLQIWKTAWHLLSSCVILLSNRKLSCFVTASLIRALTFVLCLRCWQFMSDSTSAERQKDLTIFGNGW